MNKTLKFNRFNTKKTIIQYSILLIILLFISFYLHNKVFVLISEKRREKIVQYSTEVELLKKDKEINLKKIEEEYDKKIEVLQDKIETLEKKIN